MEKTAGKAAGIRNRKHLGRCLQPFLFVVLLFTQLPAQADAQLAELRRIADTGAVQLALKLFEQHAPDIAEDPQRWSAWERERLAFYARHEQWQPMVEHINTLPPGVPTELYYDAETWRVRALLAMDKPVEARKVLRQLLWQESRTVEQVNTWRKLVIRTYLRDGSAVAANTAMVRYQQDYGEKPANSDLLRARVLILAGEDKEAAEILDKQKDPASKATWLLASLRSAKMPAKNVIKQAKKQLKKKLANIEKLRFYAVIAEASKVEKDTGKRIAAIEDIFSLTRNLDIDDGLFRFDSDSLWNAYSEHALYVANKNQLLVGDDQAWLKKIKTYKKNALRQRAMYAWLSRNAVDEALREEASDKMVKLLQKRKRGLEVIRNLYAKQLAADNNNAPAIVGYVLIDQALSESDIALASRLLSKLVSAPRGVDPLLWHLRRARVFVLAGDHDQGVKVLYRLLSSQQQLNKQQADRFMQVLFDLQTVERHEEAYDVFSRLYDHTQDVQLRREILYWMADSKKAIQDFEKASQLYIRSAQNPLDDKAVDLWGQSAFYQAAEALAKAGFINDARNIYQRLLSATDEPGRRAVLNRQVQQLLLQQQVVDKGENAGGTL